MRIFSYGGGRQSNAVLVMTAWKILQYDAFLFSNVGEDSENPDTLAYVRDIARPFAERNGIEFIELRREIRGQPVTVYQKAMEQNRTIPLPVRLSTGAFGNRICTMDWKINLIARWTKKHGATKDNPATVGLGISLDEFHRARTDSGIAWQLLEYPLIERRMTLEDCRLMILDGGLPEPPKSACYFCPFQSPAKWKQLRAEKPDLFQKAVELEKRLNEKRDALGRDTVYLHGALRPLDKAVDKQGVLWTEFDTCESGYCMI